MTARLRDFPWKTFYGPSDDRLHDFYIPALSRSTHYDRSAGYFTSTSIAIAATGLTYLIRNGGRMRLLVGASLREADVKAVEAGYDLREQLEAGLLQELQDPADYFTSQRLMALTWMIARGTLDIRVVLPLDRNGRPIATGPADPYYHIKTGVFTDSSGDKVAFTGSVNDSQTAWEKNYEDLSVYTSWSTEMGDTRAHLNGVVTRFDRLWDGHEEDWKALPVPQAVIDRLISFAPDEPPDVDPQEVPRPQPDLSSDEDERILFQFFKDAPRMPGAHGLGASTSALRPWPHQRRVADTVTERFPEGFLLCDEVGLGKTIEAGLILRQLLLDGRVQRALILAPKSVTKQFQEELYEKFIIDVPIFDGRVFRYADNREEQPTTPNPWNSQDLFIASSQLAKRRDRRDDLITAHPFDLLIVDEAHHARRREFAALDRFRPNNLLRLLRDLRQRDRARCLILMTATPLQMHPIEIYDLLRLLGLGGRWGAHHNSFLRFFTELRKDTFSDIDWPFVLQLVRDAVETGARLSRSFVRAAEEQLGPVEWQIVRQLPRTAELDTQLAQLSRNGKMVAREMLRHLTPLRKLVQRNTRDLLRKYHEKGILTEPICRRKPELRWIRFTAEEERLYDAVEVYITDFYKRYEQKRAGLGFVMTVYRKRLTSSFYALQESLVRRLEFLKGQRGDLGFVDDDIEQDELDLDLEDTIRDQEPSLYEEEIAFVEKFLADLRLLPADSKLECLDGELRQVLTKRETVVVFTQYTDTMDYLRDHLKDVYGSQVACYSGRGGELWDGSVWKKVSKESIKTLFKAGQDIKILIGTDAMSEGLNLQTCGVLFNFDLSWNPMRVEQRIGRIDRIGQKHEVIWVRNYFYEKSVEAEVYRRLESRINWFEAVVGNLQPILTQVGKVIQDLSMTDPTDRPASLRTKLQDLEDRIREEEVAGLDLDRYVEDEIAGVSALVESVPVEDIEQLFVASSRLGSRFRKHPSIEHAFELTLEGISRLVTFRPEVFDAYPETVTMLTYGQALLDDLLELMPQPATAGDESGGRVVRCETEAKDLVAFYPNVSDDVQAIESLGQLRVALTAEPVASSDAQLESASQALKTQAQRVRSQAKGVRNDLAVGDYLARQEEARLILRRAAYVDATLQGHRTMFDDSDENVRTPISTVGSLRDFARLKGFPYAPLVVLLDNEEIPLSITDPELTKLEGKSERALRALEQSVRDQAKNLLDRLMAARERIQDLQSETEEPSVSVTVLR